MATISEDYVSFETAKLLKKKGFDEICYKYYDVFEKELFGADDIPFQNHELDKTMIAVPTLQMAMKWLREVHNIDIIAPPQYDSIKWTYSAIIFKLSIPCTEIRLNDNKDKKEKAIEIAIKYCLENLI